MQNRIKSRIPEYAIRIINTNDPAVRTLDLAGTGLWDEDIEQLVELLIASNTHIEELFVHHNNFGNQGARALAKLTHITHLWVEDNNITDDGILPLISNPAFKHISLSGCYLTDNAFPILKEYTQQDSIFLSGIRHMADELILDFYRFLKRKKEARQQLEALSSVTQGVSTLTFATPSSDELMEENSIQYATPTCRM